MHCHACSYNSRDSVPELLIEPGRCKVFWHRRHDKYFCKASLRDDHRILPFIIVHKLYRIFILSFQKERSPMNS